MREPKKVERLRLTQSSLATPSRRMPSELDQAGLVRMHRQPKLLHARAHLGQESLSVVQPLESDNSVIGVTNDNHVPASVTVSPPLRPKVEDIVQVHVC